MWSERHTVTPRCDAWAGEAGAAHSTSALVARPGGAATSRWPLLQPVDPFRSLIPQIEFLYLLANATILEPVVVDAETARHMVHPYSWFLDHVSPEGIELTSAGHLRPADVKASAELDLAEEWIGKHNRKVQALPVLELRKSAMHLGMLRSRTPADSRRPPRTGTAYRLGRVRGSPK
jgi:hypothetical protein